MNELNEERALLYGFLARIFRKEADNELIDSVKNLDYSQFDAENDTDKGFLELKKVTEKISSGTLLDLARDYARTFLGAGLGRGQGAYPYESVYASVDRLLMQEQRDEVMMFYGTEMLQRSEEFKEPEDHIAFELEFMSYLITCENQAIAENDWQKIEKYRTKQHDFFMKHLGRWSGMFCDDVMRVAKEDFYKAAAMITKGFIEEERIFYSNCSTN